MALTLAQRTQLRKRAAAQAANTPAGESMAGNSTYELQLAQLHQHHQQLKQVQSTEGKGELKAKLLPDYAGYIAGVLEHGQGAEDNVLTTVMVWRLDAGDISGALDIADYVLAHKLALPDRFARDAATLVTEEIAEHALKLLKAGEPFDAALLERTNALTANCDMPDEVRAKLHAALGRSYAHGIDAKADTQPAGTLERLISAESHYTRALSLNAQAGCKKNLEEAQRILKKHAGQTS